MVKRAKAGELKTAVSALAALCAGLGLAFAARNWVPVAGFAPQYCPVAPRHSLFQSLAGDAANVVPVRRAALIEPWLVATVVVLLLAGALVGWIRERKSKVQRARLQKIYALGEEILSAASPADALERLAVVLPQQFGVSRVRLYLYNRGTKGLEEVVARAGVPAASIALESPSGLVQRAVSSCFRNKMLLSIPDSRHSPFRTPEDGQGPAPPRCMLFFPLFAQGEVEGVLQIDYDQRAPKFRPDDQVVIQHLANQAGLALKLFEQRSMREQLFRSEKLAAVGQLISGVVSELQTPLAAIGAAARQLAARDSAPDIQTDLQAIATEAGRAAGIVSRLVSFVHTGPGAAATLELDELLKRLSEFREREWKARGIQVRCQLPRGPILVSGSLGQLEQAFLNLLVHAEQALAESPVKEITIELKELAGRALVHIAYSAVAGETSDPFAPASDGTGLTVCRSVIVAQGGSVRTMRPGPSWAGFEVDLPAQERKRARGPRPARAAWSELTALSIEADECAQRRIVELLSARELRVVPVASAAEGLDLMQRLPFDLVLWAVDAPGLDYPDLLCRIQERAGSLTLIAQTRQSVPPADGCGILVKPIEEDQLDLILASAGDSKALAAARR
jgi:signal transduction histidine kinase